MYSISLFTGAMGLDLGLESSGITPILCVEKDEASTLTIALNRPKSQVARDVCRLTEKELDPHRGCFLVAGGPPCQAFSMAGSRRAFDDPRGVLLLEFGRIVNIVRPRFFVFENVKGLLSAKLEDNRSILEYVLKGYEEMGYKVVHGVLDAVDFGVPQFRERLVVMGSRDGEEIFLPKPTHFIRHQDQAYRWKTLGQTIMDLQDDPGPCGKFSPSQKMWLSKIPPGGNWRSLTEQDARDSMGAMFDTNGGRTGFMRRLSFSEPCPTLLTSPIKQATMLCHPVMDRPLSVKEYAKIQQFPDCWLFYGTIDAQYRQIGNAVPVGLAKAIGQVFTSVSSGTDLVKTKRKGH
jgi:DNA (cytosine-5)-methyltransferase 1